jgi:tetratricopeptide (TPR) repeat protein
MVRAAPTAISAYAAERCRLAQALADLGAAAEPHRLALAAFYTYRLAALSGDPAELIATVPVVDLAIAAASRPADLHLLQAKLALKLHRVPEVRLRLDRADADGASAEGLALRGDLAIQQGCYADAARIYAEALGQERAWDILARLGHFSARMGDAEAAERYLVEAQDELTAKEMRAFAWLEVERGVLDLSRGRFAESAEHYRLADRSYSGYWLVEQRLAEHAAATGAYSEAIDRYRALLADREKPEVQQALSELYHVVGDHGEADAWRERARLAYLASAARGEVHYYHHLAEFYSDVHLDNGEAIRWAAADLALRPNAETRAAMAWAEHLAGHSAEAVELIEQAITTGWADVRTLCRAADIHEAAGNESAGRRYRKLALARTPHAQGAHAGH